MAEPICPVCNQPIYANDYRCCGIDRANWRSIQIHPDCWPRRFELTVKIPGIQLVNDFEQEKQAA